MRTAQLAEWLGIADVTLRHWTQNEFREYLSPGAQGGSGRSRVFDDQDAKIMAHIVALKAAGHRGEEVHIALKRLQADDWRDLPPMPPAPPGVGPVPMVPVSTAETAVSAKTSALLREIGFLQQRVEGLEKQLADERERARDEQEALLRELADQRREMGKLENEVQLWREGRLKPKE